MKLEVKGLTRRFGSFTANDHIDLTIEPGEIHCLLGENGAGKSTLMNMLYGLLDPTEGEILLDDKPVTFTSPGDAIAAGIGMVHQHFMLVPVFTVAENVMLGREQTRGLGVLDRKKAADLVRELSDRYRLAVDPTALVESLPVGVQQRVEILKALANEAQVLILDEPTAVLTPQEIDELMDIMRSLKAQGTSIVFITHKLREVKAVGDKITVIRRGKVVGTAPPSTPEGELAEMMVGRAVKLVVDKEPAQVGDPVLDVAGITVVDSRGATVVKEVSFEARAGEVLGIAGVQGNGQTELIKSLLGLVRPDAGQIRLGARTSPTKVLASPWMPVSATSPKTAPTTGSSATSACARTSCSICTPMTNSPPGSHSNSTRSRRTLSTGSPSSTSAPSQRSLRSPRCPAVTSRRSWSPGSSPGR